ncbi:MAG TPA: 2,3-bisphosphoglycerate-independent phosphoglycerate mutase [Candidatus Limnocylindria bacterium]|nr:2,3-bisphosphoglycerate-independent phosphoglycerate mutase [Candidatus Limnocylindria bacterium]
MVILDGFGLGRRPEADAIAAARLPAWRGLLSTWPHCRLDASGEAVGLPAGQMGNSEVGHLNLGAGRPVLQDLPRIDAALVDGSFYRNDALLGAARQAAQPGRRLHLVGLLGPGGVHSVDRHAVAVARMAREAGAEHVIVHGLLDGRDTPPRSADGFVPDFDARLRDAHPGARLATIGGRYFGMDRDRRWERTAQAYEAIVHGRGVAAPSAVEAVAIAYERGENDEFVQPTVIEGVDGRLRDGDALVLFNFRADRARQLTHALVDGAEFTHFERGERPRDVRVVTLTHYEEGLAVDVAFPPQASSGLAAIFAGLGWRQLHVAETEKYAHVTYFFNGGIEAPFPGEERVLVPSLRIATYDLQPEMSADGVTDALVGAIEGDKFDLIVANYANPDMVGHTGVWEATVRGLEHLDGCLARVAGAVLEHAGGNALLCITADHGNADEMLDEAGNIVTAHSTNPVPLLLAGPRARGLRLRDGVLSDVAPTLLDLAGLPPGEGMTGRSLIGRQSGAG